MSDFCATTISNKNNVKKKQTKMCYINADSFLLYIKTDNLYQDI